MSFYCLKPFKHSSNCRVSTKLQLRSVLNILGWRIRNRVRLAILDLQPGMEFSKRQFGSKMGYQNFQCLPLGRKLMSYFPESAAT